MVEFEQESLEVSESHAAKPDSSAACLSSQFSLERQLWTRARPGVRRSFAVLPRRKRYCEETLIK
jgi:hypothetical protein